MLTNFGSLSSEELEKLYIQESQKFLAGIKTGMPHNSLQLIKLDLNRIDNELKQRKVMSYKHTA
jgi:hypothetical protein